MTHHIPGLEAARIVPEAVVERTGPAASSPAAARTDQEAAVGRSYPAEGDSRTAAVAEARCSPAAAEEHIPAAGLDIPAAAHREEGHCSSVAEHRSPVGAGEAHRIPAGEAHHIPAAEARRIPVAEAHRIPAAEARRSRSKGGRHLVDSCSLRGI